jgi:hypothetical protein
VSREVVALVVVVKPAHPLANLHLNLHLNLQRRLHLHLHPKRR